MAEGRNDRRQPTTAEVNATMARLGIGVEWTDDAVQQLTEAARAIEAHLRDHPEHRAAFEHDPAAMLRSLAARGVLRTPVDELHAALSATRAHADADADADNNDADNADAADSADAARKA